MTGYTEVEGTSASDMVMGAAARHVLAGDVPPDSCRCVVGSGFSACWHQAARLLLANGLRPVVTDKPDQPDLAGTLFQDHADWLRTELAAS